MSAQQTYAVGLNFSNFGTRQLRFVKVTATTDGSTAVDFSVTTAPSGSTQAFTDFAIATRTLQAFAEVYLLGAPGTTGFIAVIAEDTVAEADSGNSGTGYGLLETAIVAALKQNGSSRSGATAIVTTLSFAANGVSIS
jgi:hypothetical protein